MAKSRHDQIAENLAKEFGAEYKRYQGIDIVTKMRVIEVETAMEGIYQGINQIKRSPKPRYMAVDDKNIQNALEATEGTGIGVMDENGKILKRAHRNMKK